MLNIDIAISTHRPEGIQRVTGMLPESEEGVRYIVSWQDHEDYPVPDALSQRKDVEIWRCDKRGLSSNRNNAMSHCKGDIVVIADDDISYAPDFVKRIRRAFADNPDMTIALFKMDFEVKKNYPKENLRLGRRLPKNYYVSSVEICYRREDIGDLKFWEGLGLGSGSMESGEESMFVYSAIRRGLQVWFVNEYIGSHRGLTTGNKNKESRLKGEGFVMRMMYPMSFLWRMPLYSFRIWKDKKGLFFNTLFHLSAGVSCYEKKFKRLPRCYRW